MSDKIEEIRERFTNGAPWTQTTLQHDIATLLAEVERLRAESARLRAQIAEYFAEPATHPVEGT